MSVLIKEPLDYADVMDLNVHHHYKRLGLSRRAYDRMSKLLDPRIKRLSAEERETRKVRLQCVYGHGFFVREFVAFVAEENPPYTALFELRKSGRGTAADIIRFMARIGHPFP